MKHILFTFPITITTRNIKIKLWLQGKKERICMWLLESVMIFENTFSFFWPFLNMCHLYAEDQRQLHSNLDVSLPNAITPSNNAVWQFSSIMATFNAI